MQGQYFLLFVLNHLQEEGEDDSLSVQQEHIENFGGHIFRTVVDENSLKD